MAFIQIYETDEQEAARLAQAPEGSTTHYLSGLPVTFKKYARGSVLRLKQKTGEVLIVAPVEFHKGSGLSGPRPVPYDGSWTCIILGGSDPRYQQGYSDLNISESEIRRGEEIKIPAVHSPSLAEIAEEFGESEMGVQSYIRLGRTLEAQMATLRLSRAVATFDPPEITKALVDEEERPEDA